MNKNYRIIDENRVLNGGYLKTVCFRNMELKNQLSVSKWLQLTLVEMIVGAELLESLVTTGSVSTDKNFLNGDSANYGNELHLSLHIPGGIITNLLKNQIIELLYYKFHWQYLILDQVGDTYIDDKANIISCTRTRFRARKDLFYQFIALRRVYDLFWLVFNLIVDSVVFLVTKDIQYSLISALTIEAIRRVLRV
jgi:hypothetical protein